MTYSLALLEIGNLTPSLIVADYCSKAAGVQLLGIESTDGPQQCIKFAGPTADIVTASPIFAPQVAKVLAPERWLTVESVAQALVAG